jgi:hypothetical protein
MEVRSSSRVPRRLAVAVLGLLVGAALTLVWVSPAQAASWRPISGETYSNTNWYCSSTIRVKELTGSIEAYFNYLPSPLGNGLRFGVGNTGCSLLSFDDFDTLGNSQTVMLSMQNRQQFKNMFRRLTACQSWSCSHTFGGGEYY